MINLIRQTAKTVVLSCFCLSFVVIPTQAETAIAPTVKAERGAIVSAHPLATETGIATLARGGNAVDAAVATTFAISVVEPFSAGIGGGGFLLHYQAETGEIEALDFRERAPLAATRDMYLDENDEAVPGLSLNGHLAAGVPGTVAGLYALHQRYGKLPWETVLAPAIRLAEEGFEVSDHLATRMEQRRDVLQANPAARSIFLRADGSAYETGETLVQTDLAATLRAIADDPDRFYEGEIGEAIARDMEKNGGLITLEDLDAYEVKWRDPLCGAFRRWRVCSMPPPSSGGVHLLQILQIVGDTDLAALARPEALHLLVEAMKIAYSDRSVYLGDPDFVPVPATALTSAGYAAWRRSQIDPERSRPASEIDPVAPEILSQWSPEPVPDFRGSALPPRESPDTSHLTVVDRDGNAISLTFTINTGFGAAVVAEGTGILLNNEMDDFAIAPGVPNAFGLLGAEANSIAPGKTPLSSMTPTIVTESGKLVLATGSPGGSTIITTVLQVLLNVLVFDRTAGEAVSAPRLHHQWQPDRLLADDRGFAEETLEALRRKGHKIRQRSGWGNAGAIVVTEEGLAGAADPRGEGTAAGL